MSGTSPLFLDTSGLVALLVADDALHDLATQHFEQIGQTERSMVTTDWVLAELGNSLARTPARMLGAEFIGQIISTPRVQFVYIDASLMDRGLKRYAQYDDKTWGLVDCVSFEVMADTGCVDAFTHDHHFEQAGYQRLLG